MNSRRRGEGRVPVVPAEAAMTPWSPLLDASDLTAEHNADMRHEHDGDWIDERVPTRGEADRDEWGEEW